MVGLIRVNNDLPQSLGEVRFSEEKSQGTGIRKMEMGRQKQVSVLPLISGEKLTLNSFEVAVM